MGGSRRACTLLRYFDRNDDDHEEGGEGHLRPEDAEPCPCGDLRCEVVASHGGDEEDLGLHQEERVEQRPDHQARCDVEGDLPGVEYRHLEDGWLREQAPVVRPWASPGHLAEEFRRRAGLSSRDLQSCTRPTWTTIAYSFQYSE